MPATITISGVTYYSVNSVSVRGKRMIVDGQDVTVDDAPRITIEVHGNIETLQCDNCDTATIRGEVGSVTTASGNVQCGDVRGSVRTASGNVNCGDIGGEAKTASGNVSQR
ncbi:Phage protein [Candidatus Burkholderia brachyanthoides]|nr:Phage protein [Candidatus Burkholderia brachyanthoides]